MHLPAAACLALCDALPRADGLEAALAIVDGVRRDLLGPGLLTVNLRCDSGPVPPGGTLVLQRIWTSDAQAYPVAGRKHKTLTPWTRQLLLEARVFVGEGRQRLSEVFDDHALIDSLGLQAIVNVPLLDAHGRCFATFNALGTRPVWQAHEVLLLRLLATLATPAVARTAGTIGRQSLAA
ncbi:GAF domain-containing protein [Xylophilus sp. Leaf220]|uniref:GAF domain-containing protein n=1 Tax=Xylophilus sp. Leaf220 TaxID=1735686 RepID=UPI0012E19B20|nr:GAF domain-containing protein [Xylophilus sp. Leaf220]